MLMIFLVLKRYELAVRVIDEIGSLVGGWLKARSRARIALATGSVS